MGDNAPKFMLSLIRLTMFQNSYTVAQLTFYMFFVGDSVDLTRTCFGMVVVVCFGLFVLCFVLFLDSFHW